MLLLLLILSFTHKHEYLDKCKGKNFRNGVCYNDSKTCEEKCKLRVPGHLRDTNYCSNIEDVYVCHPPHW